MSAEVPPLDARLVAFMQRFARHPSEQTDRMEQDPAVLSFVKDCVAPLLDAPGVRWDVDRFGNLVCEAGPSDAPMPVLFLAYAMTHPANQMRNPFAGELLETDGGPVVRGRGISEQKSSLAASLTAFLDAAASGRLEQRIGWVLLTAGETGRHDAVAVALETLGAKPRFGILAIGTASRIALGNRGRLDVDVRITGRPSHSSTPSAGVDVTRGVRLVLERAEAENAELPSHPDLGPATLTCTSIKTFPDATHTVQSLARMVFDRRLMPEEGPEEVLERLRNLFALPEPLGCEVSRGPFMYGSLINADGALLSEIRAALAAHNQPLPETFYSSGSLDAGYLIQHGIESVKWGPGDPSQFHTDEEQVTVAEVARMTCSYGAIIDALAMRKSR